MKIITLHNEPEKRHAVVTDSGNLVRAFIHRYDALSFLDHIRQNREDPKNEN